MNEQKQAELDTMIQNALKDGKLYCAQALKIAAEIGVPPAIVGGAANRLKIKIAGCQLGCFK